MPAQRKIKLVIAYDGTDYHGWQIQPGYSTVQGALCEAATAMLRNPTAVQGASRTDAGVHAMGQVGLIKTMNPIVAEHLALGLNEFLPRDIAVLSAKEVGPDFDLNGHVTRKAYRYTIYTGRIRSVRRIRFCWHYPSRLAVEAMQAAARFFAGSHDFRSFAAALEPGENTVRTLHRCEVTAGCNGDPDTITIDLEGDGFLHHMARILVGTLVDVGRGHWRPVDMTEMLAARDRQAAGHLAPAAGLCLEWIRYRQDESGDESEHSGCS
ncbi:MAG: tRNA pseudouridine(38-40) synthase TruA [Phycisphaerae bacterium]|nr:tRNA pseudouridine(38-40) synthase TruA [Phycisphaerae bacterium]